MSRTRVLLGIHTLPGHFNPMIGVAQRLSKAGCEIATFSEESLAERMTRAGVQVREHVAGRPKSVSPPKLTVDTSLSRLAQFNDVAWLSRYFELILAAPVKRQVAALEPIIADFRPDVICTDPLFYAVAICAERTGTAWASLYTTFVPWVHASWNCAYKEALESLHPILERKAGALGASLRLKIGHAVSPWLNTAYTVPELTPPTRGGTDYALPVGPSRALVGPGDEIAFPWECLRTDRPLVYVTSGTQFLFSRRFYQVLLEAVHPLGVQLVVSGPAPDEISGPEVVTVPYAPSAKLIARAAMVINHGGPASVMDCLDQGVPMLVVPLGHDQSWQGKFVASCGAGLVLDPDRASAETLREAVRHILEKSSPERACARRLAETCQHMDGASRVAELTLSLARKQRSVGTPS